jgi:hypothetical protein
MGMGIFLKFFWITIGTLILATLLIFAIMGVPAPKVEVKKTIPMENLFRK